jgi:NADH:ubiquinone oxidoreductase subunit 6 (subunit J)
MVQFLVVVNNQPEDFEFGLTIAVIPITIVILIAAAFFVRRENKLGTLAVMICYLGALTYFIFKLVRIYQPGFRELYRPVRRSLTAFSVITILLLVLTIANAVVCMRNFGEGLTQHLKSAKAGRDEEKTDMNSISLSELKQPQVPSRMTID